MKRFTAASAALLMMAGAASAQDAIASQVSATSTVPGYPNTVVGTNGVTYACGPLVGGVYNCVSASGAASAGAGFAGVGAGSGATIVAVVVGVAAVVAIANSNGTN